MNTSDGLKLKGLYNVECYGPDGKLKWTDTAENAMTNTAITAVLDIINRGQTTIASIFMSLVDNAAFSAFAAADTYSSHSGWAEFSTYSQSTRPAWTCAAAASQSISNTSAVVFSITGSGTLKGLSTYYGTGTTVKGDSVSGAGKVLYTTAAFSGGNQAVSNGDTLNVTYTMTGSST